jgi:hypothetical protein
VRAILSTILLLLAMTAKADLTFDCFTKDGQILMHDTSRADCELVGGVLDISYSKPSYEAGNKRPVDLAEIAEYPWILFGSAAAYVSNALPWRTLIRGVVGWFLLMVLTGIPLGVIGGLLEERRRQRQRAKTDAQRKTLQYD